MSGYMEFVWDDIVKMGNYREVLFKLYERILKKHDEKGRSYLKMTLKRLLHLLDDEVTELYDARVFTNIIEEGLDVAICGLLIADWAIQRGKQK